MDTTNKPNATDDQIIAEMLEIGGQFIKALAQTWRVADPVNRRVIRETWPYYFNEYATAVHYKNLAVEADRMGRN